MSPTVFREVKFDASTHTFTGLFGERVPSVTQILATAGLCDYSAVPQEYRDRGMRRGSSVHWMLQLHDEGALNYRTVPKSLRPFRKAYQTWKAGSGFHPIAIEFKFVWDGYAGILDRAGSFPATSMFTDGSHAIVDFKTGTTMQEWVKYQLAAYAVGFMQDIKLARFIRRIALLLKPDGTYSVKEFPLSSFDTDWSTFCRAKEKTHGGHTNCGG